MDIYVRNLDSTIKESDLRELFATHGAIASVNILTDQFTGLSKGCGYIIMPNDQEALIAISALNNFQLGHSAMAVIKTRLL